MSLNEVAVLLFITICVIWISDKIAKSGPDTHRTTLAILIAFILVVMILILSRGRLPL